MSRAKPLPRSGDCSKAVMVGIIGRLRKPWRRRLCSAWVTLLILFDPTTNGPPPIRHVSEDRSRKVKFTPPRLSCHIELYLTCKYRLAYHLGKYSLAYRTWQSTPTPTYCSKPWPIPAGASCWTSC